MRTLNTNQLTSRDYSKRISIWNRKRISIWNRKRRHK